MRRLKELDATFRAAITSDRREELAEQLHVSPDSLDELGLGWATSEQLRELKASGAGWTNDYPNGAYTFAERRGDGQIVGFTLRATDSRKGAPKGMNRGLAVPSGTATASDPVLLVEGPSDAAACRTLGLAAIGRPSNRGGASELAQMLRGRRVIVVGENDSKPDGSWPGRDGALLVAQGMAEEWQQDVPVAFPPDAKDVRRYLEKQIDAGLDITDPEACRSSGLELVRSLETTQQTAEPPEATIADRCVNLAIERFRFGRDKQKQAFAIDQEKPSIAFPLDGTLFKRRLARAFRDRYRKTPNGSALTDAMNVIQGLAEDAEPEDVAIRVAWHGDSIVLDLAHEAIGKCIVVSADGWKIEDESPVVFKRTALSSPLPVPDRHGDLDQLRSLLNVDEDAWLLLRGWMAATLVPDIPHPILLFGGEQGTGKSTAAQLVVSVVDPSTAPLRTEPRDPENWAVAAAGSWTVVLDNVSQIRPWFSDALCKAVTGDGMVRRALYSNNDITVISFQRVIAMTSIDAGALRGDLADRLIVVDLEVIPDARRRTSREIWDEFHRLSGSILGGLLDLLSKVLADRENVVLDKMPRMADFARILGAIDLADGVPNRSTQTYLGQRTRLDDDVIEGDLVAQAIINLMTRVPSWEGTSGELLDAIQDDPSKQWPKNARAMTARLKRAMPVLRRQNIHVNIPTERSNRGRIYTITREDPDESPASDPPNSGGVINLDAM